MSRKSRLSMPRSLMAWLSGLIVSRGMSQVSEMILATVSKDEGISKSLIGHAFRATAADVFAIAGRIAPERPIPREMSAARIAKRQRKFNGAARARKFRRLKALEAVSE